MANQIAIAFATRPEGAQGVAAHVNDFWEPRMRRHLFVLLDAGDANLHPLVRDAAPHIRRPPSS